MSATPPKALPPSPTLTPVNRPYWEALAQGTLQFQACACGHRWLPPREACPVCLGTDWRWTPACGRASLVSWTVFHVAYHPAFADRLPYNVAVVELVEGPRMISNIISSPDGTCLKIGMPLTLAIEQESDEMKTAVARFKT